jgi:hypothetical protein
LREAEYELVPEEKVARFQGREVSRISGSLGRPKNLKQMGNQQGC